MGTLELDMVLDQFKGMTRYAAYYSGPAELGLKHIDKKATMELFVKDIQALAGGIPPRIKVTVEWDFPAPL